MNVVILAADPKDTLLSDGDSMPRCFLPLNENLTILERQIRTLELYGINSNDIVLVIGAQGPWEKSGMIEKAKDTHSNIAINRNNAETGGAASLDEGLKSFRTHEDVLIVDGDLVFDSKLLDQLTNVPDNANALLTRKALSISEEGSRINVEHGKVISCGKTATVYKNFPWHLYNGIAYLRQDAITLLKDRLQFHRKGNLLDAVCEIAAQKKIIAVDITQPVSGEDGSMEKLADLAGGSYATLTRRSVVLKEAAGDGMQKLHDEILWLKGLPEFLRPYFPKLLDYYIESGNIKFEMPFYDRPSLRKKIMTGDFNAENACSFMSEVLDFMFNNVYNQGIRVAPSDWLIEKHLDRVHKRLVEMFQQSEILRSLIEADVIVLNGQKYRNIADITFEIAKRSKLIKALSPSHLRMVHGDLHFQNILVGPLENNIPFLLLDPRGDLSGSDLFYDMGKLWHSINGKYDFLHTNQFLLSVDVNKERKSVDAKLVLSNKKASLSFESILDKMPGILEEHTLIKGDPDWLMKTLFSEAMHFCSVMPFHIRGDGKDEKAVTMYLTGVKLLNEFYDKYEIGNWPEDQNLFLINVNTQTDYIKALKMITTEKTISTSFEGN